MKAIHWRIKVTYNFEKKVNLEWCQTDARPDIGILKGRFFEKAVINKATMVVLNKIVLHYIYLSQSWHYILNVVISWQKKKLGKITQNFI